MERAGFGCSTSPPSVVAYALGPIDLIPDSIAVLGYLDDLVLLPLGIYLAVKMIPRPVMEECRRQPRLARARKQPASRRTAAAVIVLLWIAAAAMISLYVIRALGS